MSQDNERRAHKRFRVKDLEGSLLSAPDVTIRNISLNGAQVQTSKRLSIGRTYFLKVKTGKLQMTLKGVTAWCMLRGSRVLGDGQQVPIYTAGLRFTDEEAEGRSDMLRAFLEETQSHIREQRIGEIRFRVSGPYACHMDAGCRIRQLSRGGMEIVTEEFQGEEVNAHVDVEMDLDGELVKVRCRVANSSHETDSAMVRLGLEFQLFEGDGQRILDRFIQDLEQPG